MAELAPKPLPSGANAYLETQQSPEGIVATFGNWGTEYTSDQVSEILVRQGVPEKEVESFTGFSSIFHEANNLPRELGVIDELVVADMITTETLDANHWDPIDVDAIFVGSGVPVVDETTEPNYAKIIASRMGMRKDVVTHSTYAACTSGAHEFLRALRDPNLQGKNVIVMAMEGITPLTKNLDPEYADPFSIRVFSNGAAAIGFVPGEDITLVSSKEYHPIFEDKAGVLRAKMTYGDLLDTEKSDVWQENDEAGIHMIRYPQPEGDRLLTLNNRTAMFFIENMLPLIHEVYRDHTSEHPGIPINLVAAHHASEPVNRGLSNRLARAHGISPEMFPIPWVVYKGNSSAATFLIAAGKLLPNAKAGDYWAAMGYGAGGSGDVGIITFGARR